MLQHHGRTGRAVFLIVQINVKQFMVTLLLPFSRAGHCILTTSLHFLCTPQYLKVITALLIGHPITKEVVWSRVTSETSEMQSESQTSDSGTCNVLRWVMANYMSRRLPGMSCSVWFYYWVTSVFCPDMRQDTCKLAHWLTADGHREFPMMAVLYDTNYAIICNLGLS